MQARRQLHFISFTLLISTRARDPPGRPDALRSCKSCIVPVPTACAHRAEQRRSPVPASARHGAGLQAEHQARVQDGIAIHRHSMVGRARTAFDDGARLTGAGQSYRATMKTSF